jgi:hypothetical protein
MFFLWTEGFSCSLDVLHEGLGIIFEKKNFILFSAVKFSMFDHQNPGSGTALKPMQIQSIGQGSVKRERIFDSATYVLSQAGLQ